MNGLASKIGIIIFMPGKWFVTSDWFLEGFWQSVTCGCRKRRRGGGREEGGGGEGEGGREGEGGVGGEGGRGGEGGGLGRKEGREQHDNCDTRVIQSAAIAFSKVQKATSLLELGDVVAMPFAGTSVSPFRS